VLDIHVPCPSLSLVCIKIEAGDIGFLNTQVISAFACTIQVLITITVFYYIDCSTVVWKKYFKFVYCYTTISFTCYQSSETLQLRLVCSSV